MPLRLETVDISSLHITGCRAWIVATAFGPDEDKPVAITHECVTLTQLEREISRIQDDLKVIREQARERFPKESQG